MKKIITQKELLKDMLRLSKFAAIAVNTINKIKKNDPGTARQLRKDTIGYIKDNTK